MNSPIPMEVWKVIILVLIALAILILIGMVIVYSFQNPYETQAQIVIQHWEKIFLAAILAICAGYVAVQ